VQVKNKPPVRESEHVLIPVSMANNIGCKKTRF
jgi:hypothetical protein